MAYIRYWLWSWHHWRMCRATYALMVHANILAEIEQRPPVESIHIDMKELQ